MDILHLLNSTFGFIQRVLELDERAWKRVVGIGRQLIGRGEPQQSYENLSLAVELELCDVRGRRAVIRRKQRVRFLSDEAGVVRDVIWGEGETLAGYRVEGAKKLSVRQEGSKKVVLLGLPANPAKGASVTLKTERIIRGGFRPDEGYLEVVVERPTRRLRLSVLFPRGRPPKHARVETSPPALAAHPVALRLTADGRTYATWPVVEPKHLVTYRVCWSW